ncbi:MAG: hypothetical protein KBB83_01540 [Alphaproteobacteria bacterium]|nr:hypothetical protein [Alphaproteobacteria bacterium]
MKRYVFLFFLMSICFSATNNGFCSYETHGFYMTRAKAKELLTAPDTPKDMKRRNFYSHDENSEKRDYPFSDESRDEDETLKKSKPKKQAAEENPAAKRILKF